MIDYEKLLLDIVKPLCSNENDVMVKHMESLDENEVLLYVYANSEDLGRLIGKKGQMANSIRTMVQVGAKISKQKINIKFEAL